MRTRLIVLAAVVAVLAGGSVAAAYAYSNSKSDQIAAGVTVNNIPIGGLTRAQAEKKLSDALLTPLNRPVKITYHDRTFTLSQKAAAVGINISGAVDQALKRSQEGGMFSRAWRNLRNKSVNSSLAAQITYDDSSIEKVVKRIRKAIDREPRSASLDLSKGKVEPTKSQTGLRVKYNTLAKEVEQTLLTPGKTDPVKVQTTVVQPKVTTATLAKQYPAVIIVNRSTFKLTLYKNLKATKTYGIAVGQVGLETPAGLYHIQNKAENPAWHVPNSAWAGSLAGKVIPAGDPGNPIKARWMGIYDGAGIHGTSEDGSIGSAASHGCVRMHVADVEELYPQVPVGAPVYIA